MKIIKASIIGFGTVGQGIAKVLMDKSDYLKNIGLEIKVIAIADSKGSEVNLEGINLVDAIKRKKESGTVALESLSGIEIIENIEHELVIETTPTNAETGGIGLLNMLKAFECGRDVVTSNKGPLTIKYNELINASKKSNSAFKFEATVGGAMPTINLIKDVLIGNDIRSIQGILNGTCNYILTRMEEEQASYEQILAESIELGIAETDPSYDVEGYDTAYKLVILAQDIFKMDVGFKDVEITGITQITKESLNMAKSQGYSIKLIGEIEKDLIRVAPRLVPQNHPLSVKGTMNVAYIQTDLSGPITITGMGAGSIETASAILSDIISIYK
ncbi:MAG: homoserine dehydrogenase [Methanosarcinaceae archaeon]|jgi:homoserine dehydrogenase|nr:homoserine dehydrogenase [Methanosarcinaceae archaeon]NKQ39477.1 homoserine dehydrogenase [Methanosarcinales archaeon]